MSLITSSRNERVRMVRALQTRSRIRRQERRTVLEGVRLIADALRSGVQPDFVCFTAEAREANRAVATLLEQIEASGTPCLPVLPALMDEMAETETPQGILAVVPWPDLPIPAAPALVLVVDGWRDPGNLGTALRTAAAAGVELVALMPGTVDALGPKALRAGMGAQFRVPAHSFSWATLRARFAEHVVYLAEMDGTMPYDAADWSRPALIVVGEEAHGLSADARALPHTSLRIPMVSSAESLNAAVSASLLIYAARRGAL